MDAHIYPNEKRFEDEINSGDRWKPSELIEELKLKARADNLWNLFLPEVSGLSNLEYQFHQILDRDFRAETLADLLRLTLLPGALVLYPDLT